MSKKISLNRRFMSFILIICMLFTMIPNSASAVKATDVSNHWAQNIIEGWMDKDLIKGYPDGSFKPDNNITRAEFSAMVNRAFGYTSKTPISYPDVKEGEWYYASLEIAVAAGYIGGYPDGTMRPNNPITREEAASLLAKLNRLTENESAAGVFTDSAKFYWSKGAIGAVSEAKLMGGYPDGSFGNNKFIKRGEAVASLDRTLQYRGKVVQAVTVNDTLSDAETTLTFMTNEEISAGVGTSSGGGGSSGGGVSSKPLSQAAPKGLAGIAPTTASGTDGKITGTTAEMEYRIPPDGTWIPVTGTEITGLAAGSYDVRYAAKEGYNAGEIAKVAVPAYVAPEADQPAPEGLAGIAPTTAGGTDGKITGTTAEMEYKSASGQVWTPAAGTQITGLAAGAYNVRYAAKAGYKSGAIATVTVPDYVETGADQPAPEGLAGIAPTTADGTDGKITGTTADMEYRQSSEETWTAADGAEITGLAAGWYDVRYAAKEGYKSGAIATVPVPAYVAPEADQPAPEGLAGIAPTTAGGTDGKITGTAAEMEYKSAAGEIWTSAEGTEITGLAAGFYDVRYAAKEGYKAGATATVTVPDYAAPGVDQPAPEGLVGIAPSVFGATDGKITGTTAEMEYRILPDGTWIPVTGTEITGLAAGSYDVRYAAKEGYNAGAVVTVIVSVGANQDQPMPEGLVGVAPSSFGGTDGKITGTTADMEYRPLVDGAPWISSTGTEITELEAGWYDVRYAAKEGYNAGAAATVQVQVPSPLNQPAPEGLVAVAPTTFGGTDGKITGTTAEMEYRIVPAETWIPVTGTEITSLAAGFYDVRYATKIGYNAGAAATIQVKEAEATLSALAIDGNAVNGFSAGVLVYDMELPAGTVIVPTVTATATDINAPVVITPASSLPGKTTVLVTAQDGINTQTYTINFILANQVPLNLKGVAPTTSGGTDGKITGTTDEMEYKSEAEATWTPVAGTEITGLAAGTYNVRYAAKEGYSVGLPANVVVPNPGSGKLVITFDDGWKDTITVAYPVLEQAGLKATVYVNRDMTWGEEYGWGNGNFMNYNDLHTLYDNGWDVSNHTTNHLDYKRNSEGQLVDKEGNVLLWQTPELYGAAHPEIAVDQWYDEWIKTLYAVGSDPGAVDSILKPIYLENQEWLSRDGLDYGPDGINPLGKMIDGVWTPGKALNMPLSAYHVAYPSGLYSEELIQMLIANGAMTGRATMDNPANSNNVMNPVKDFFRLPVQYVETQLGGENGITDENLAEVLASIDYAVDNSSTVILMIHRVGSVGDLFVSTESFNAIVNHAKDLKNASQLDVMTMSQWYNMMK